MLLAAGPPVAAPSEKRLNKSEEKGRKEGMRGQPV